MLLINNKILFIIVMRARTSKLSASADSMSQGMLSGFFSLCPHMTGGTSEPWGSLVTGHQYHS